MSFVLDALKRSEQDRNQGQMPNLVDNGSLVHLNAPQRQWWPYVLIAVLLANALVFLYIALEDNNQLETTPSDVSEQSIAPSLTEAKPRTAEPDSPVIALPSNSTTGSVATGSNELTSVKRNRVSIDPIATHIAETEPAVTAKQPDREGVIDWAARERKAKDLIAAHKTKDATYNVVDDQPVRIDPRPRQIANDNASAGSVGGYERISPKATPKGGALAFPVVAELPPSQDPQDKAKEAASASLYSDVLFLYEQDPRSRPRVPKLTFNSHIYSESPSARRVMINNIYLREGQQFMGMEVIEIGEFNITFKKEGELFKLPAMRDWNG